MNKLFSRDPAVAVDYDLVCFSDLRWEAVVERTQQLMARFAKRTRVFFIEEPVFEPSLDHLAMNTVDGVTVITPHLQLGTDPRRAESTLRRLLQSLFAAERIERYVLWYCTPEMLPLTWLLTPLASVYDCAEAPASPETSAYESSLFEQVDLVIARGHAVRDAIEHRHAGALVLASADDASVEALFARIDGVVHASTRRQHARLAARTLRSDVRYPNTMSGKGVTGCGVAASALFR